MNKITLDKIKPAKVSSTIFYDRGGSRDFEKGWSTMLVTMVGQRRKF